MTPERWQRVKAVVADAAELDPAARADFLARECSGDTGLRREVESMLGYAGDRVEDAAGALHRVPAADRDNAFAGVRLGAYEVVREIGRGGMGAVYLGRRADEQFHKEVAIKVLKRGTDTDEVLRRFRAEREILARLEHPNIARLLDAGTTDDGLPYFVMEYVAGAPITDFCTERRLSVDDRLRLFLKVCAAVQFAHQNLVVHRDIKPGNILVTTEGEPKLLDFGIAKLLATDDSPGLTITLADQQRLTPGYASPEQVRGEPITTVSDVYSLGALLYELLSGKTPHRFATVRPSPTELLRVIAEETPTRPSAAAESPAIARRVRGDLDRIILQALRKEPARRYPGVNAFAEDLHRFLNKFPVRARRDTIVYRTSRFVQRHAIGVAAASLALAALIAALFLAQRERTKAVQRFNDVRELARAVVFDYHDAIAGLPGSTAVRQRLVADALQYLDKLSQQAGNDRSLQREVASAYEKVAGVQGGRAFSASGSVLSRSNLGDTQGATASLEKALAIRERLAAGEPRQREDAEALAITYLHLAGVRLSAGGPEKVIELCRKALAIAEPLLAADPASEKLQDIVAGSWFTMGMAYGSPAYANIGDPKTGLEYTQKAAVVHERLASAHPTRLNYKYLVADEHNSLGFMYSALGDKEKHAEHFFRALELTRELVAAEPGNLLYQRDLAVHLGNAGFFKRATDLPLAMQYFREALAIYESLAAADPHDGSVRREWAVATRNLAVMIGSDDPPEALRLFSKASDILRDLVARDPKSDDVRRQWAFTYLAVCRFQIDAKQPQAAIESAAEGIRIGEALVADSPTNVAPRNTVALLYTWLGHAHVKAAEMGDAPKQQWRAAREAYAKSLAIYEELKTGGKLTGADAKKPDELTAEIAKCDAAWR